MIDDDDEEEMEDAVVVEEEVRAVRGQSFLLSER